jgi:aldehyde:ferredoxin oxidoreductase
VAKRIVDARKRFNVRVGWLPEDDRLPDRLLDDVLREDGAPAALLTRCRLREMIRAYNVARGWSEDGYPEAGDDGWTVASAPSGEPAA